MPSASGGAGLLDVRDGTRAVGVYGRQQLELVAVEFEFEQLLHEAKPLARHRVGVELGLVRRLRHELDAVGARSDSRAAKDDGVAKEVARHVPPGRVGVNLERGAVGRVLDTKAPAAVQVREDGEAGLVMLELGRGHELAQPRDVEVDLGARRCSPQPQQRAEELEQRAPPHRDAVGLVARQHVVEGVDTGLVHGDGEVLGGALAAELGEDPIDVPCLREQHRTVATVTQDLDAEDHLGLADDGDAVALAVGLDEVRVDEVAASAREADADIVHVDGEAHGAIRRDLAPDVRLDSAAFKTEAGDGLGVASHPQLASLLGALERLQETAGRVALLLVARRLLQVDLGAIPVARRREGLDDVDLEQVVVIEAATAEEAAQALKAQGAAEAVDVVKALDLAVVAADVARLDLELLDGAVRLVLDREDPLALDRTAARGDGLDELPGLEDGVLALDVIVARSAPLRAVDGVADRLGVVAGWARCRGRA